MKGFNFFLTDKGGYIKKHTHTWYPGGSWKQGLLQEGPVGRQLLLLLLLLLFQFLLLLLLFQLLLLLLLGPHVVEDHV